MRIHIPVSYTHLDVYKRKGSVSVIGQVRMDYGNVISTLGSIMQDFQKMVWGEEENKNLPEPPQQDDQ